MKNPEPFAALLRGLETFIINPPQPLSRRTLTFGRHDCHYSIHAPIIRAAYPHENPIEKSLKIPPHTKTMKVCHLRINLAFTRGPS